ncbi:uncharacterized protein LOC131521843 [Onychostoma macrolepis]|uniref:uncharacterized protein LOC131521843 n=1 Tax=Onychostoma macrolepis TaxID=369639 RepID=UPI00272B284E|nr:uncharacterized protein LOC131521843 [Onychostoma macrolepis]
MGNEETFTILFYILQGLEIVFGIAVFALTILKGYITFCGLLSLYVFRFSMRAIFCIEQILNYIFSSLQSFLIGSLTVLAAHKRTTRWIRASQSLNYLNAITSIFSIPFHGFANDGVTHIVLMVCDALVFVFSITVASTSCCGPKRRPVYRQYSTRVYHRNRPLPGVTVNNIVFVTQPNSAATPTVFSSVQYGLQSEYGPAFSR